MSAHVSTIEPTRCQKLLRFKPKLKWLKIFCNSFSPEIEKKLRTLLSTEGCVMATCGMSRAWASARLRGPGAQPRRAVHTGLGTGQAPPASRPVPARARPEQPPGPSVREQTAFPAIWDHLFQ